MSLSVAPPLAPTLSWHVTSETVEDAFEQYRHSMSDWYDISEAPHDGRRDFLNRTSVTLFPNGTIGRGRSVSQTMRRAPADIRRSHLDMISLFVDRAGLVGDCDGVDVRGSPGSVHFRDLTRPTASRVKHIDVVSMMIPRDDAPPWLTDGSAHGLMLAGDTAAGRLMASHMTVLAEVASGLTPDEGAAAIEATLLIAERATGRMRAATAAQAAAVHRTVRVRADQAIERRLFDRTLDVEAVARAVGVSRTTLYRAFADRGGVDRRIQARRLDRARDALRRRVGRSPTVAEIACAHGFASEAHFSRAFRARFGHAPTETSAARLMPQFDAWQGDAMAHGVILDWLRRRPER